MEGDRKLGRVIGDFGVMTGDWRRVKGNWGEWPEAGRWLQEAAGR
jgi:hypothetical protein